MKKTTDQIERIININKVIRNNYSRKIFAIDEVASYDFKDLEHETKEAINLLPIIEVPDFDNSEQGFFMDFSSLGLDEKEHQFYILHTNNKEYILVDNQGYNYARYTLQLINFKFRLDEIEPDELEKMAAVSRAGSAIAEAMKLNNMSFEDLQVIFKGLAERKLKNQ